MHVTSLNRPFYFPNPIAKMIMRGTSFVGTAGFRRGGVEWSLNSIHYKQEPPSKIVQGKNI